MYSEDRIHLQYNTRICLNALLFLQMCIYEFLNYVGPETMRNVSKGPLAHDESNAMLTLGNVFFVVRIQLFR